MGKDLVEVESLGEAAGDVCGWSTYVCQEEESLSVDGALE